MNAMHHNKLPAIEWSGAKPISLSAASLEISKHRPDSLYPTLTLFRPSKMIKTIYICVIIMFASNADKLRGGSQIEVHLSGERVRTAQFVVLGEVKSLELIDSFQLDDRAEPRRMVKVRLLVSAYWKPTVLAEREVFIYLSYPGDYGVEKILLGYRYFVIGSIRGNGLYYADLGSRNFYSYVNRVEKIFGISDPSDPQAFEDKNLILIKNILGHPRLFESKAEPKSEVNPRASQ